jgi:hypothetical protein
MISKFVFIGLANAVNRIVGKTSAFAGVKTMLEAANHDFGDKLPLVVWYRSTIDLHGPNRLVFLPTRERKPC